MVEQHIHCTLCGRVMAKPLPGTVAPAVVEGVICSLCASALNVKEEATR
jgi:hypothetical protein